MLSRTKPAMGSGTVAAGKDIKKGKKMPTVEEFLEMRDYTGAITLLEVTLTCPLFKYSQRLMWHLCIVGVFAFYITKSYVARLFFFLIITTRFIPLS